MDLFVKTTEKGGKYLKKADSVGFVQWKREEGKKNSTATCQYKRHHVSRRKKKTLGVLFKKHLLLDYKRSSVSPASSCGQDERTLIWNQFATGDGSRYKHHQLQRVYL